jgi:hypothetical protein
MWGCSWLLALVEPDERGDPMSPPRWTTKSTRDLAGELTAQGRKVSADTVGDHCGPKASARRGHRPRLKAGLRTGRRPFLTLADRLLAALLHYRLAMPQVAIAACSASGPRRSTSASATSASSWTRPGTPIQPGPHRIASLDAFYTLARSIDIIVWPEIKAAC